MSELAEELPRFSPRSLRPFPAMVAGTELTAQVELAILCLLRDFTLCERAPGYDKTQLCGPKPSKGLCTACHYLQ